MHVSCAVYVNGLFVMSCVTVIAAIIIKTTNTNVVFNFTVVNGPTKINQNIY